LDLAQCHPGGTQFDDELKFAPEPAEFVGEPRRPGRTAFGDSVSPEMPKRPQNGSHMTASGV